MPTSVLLAVLAAAGLLALAPALIRRYDATERLAAERATSTARVLSRRRRRRTVPGRRPINPPRFMGTASVAARARRSHPFRPPSALIPGPPGRSGSSRSASAALGVARRRGRPGGRRVRPRRRPVPDRAAPAPAGAARPGPAEPGRAGRGAAGRAGLLDRVLGLVRGAAGLPGLPAPSRRGGPRLPAGPPAQARLDPRRAGRRTPRARPPGRRAAGRRPARPSPSGTGPAGRPPRRPPTTWSATPPPAGSADPASRPRPRPSPLIKEYLRIADL